MMAKPSILQSCKICKESHPASMFCVDCQEPLCDDQVDFHLRYRLFHDHIVIPIEEYYHYQNTHSNLGFLHHKSCIEHNRPFEFLDVKTKTHNQLHCSKCLNGKQTFVIGLDDCASSLLREKLDHIRELGSQGTAHLAELREEEDIFTSRLKDLEKSRTRSLSEIRRVFGSLHEALQTRQSELEREVEELSKSAVFALSEERERSRVWQGQLSLLEKCVEEIISQPYPKSSLLSSESPSPPSQPVRSLLSSSIFFPDSSSSNVLSHKALMVDVCLLEDALRSSLSSSRASSSLTDVQSRVRVSKIRDQIEFLFQFFTPPPSTSNSPSSPSSSISQSSKEEDTQAFNHLFDSMFSVTSTSESPFRSDWSKNKVQSKMTFYSQGRGDHQLTHPHGLTYSPDLKLFYVCDHYNNRIQVFRNHPQAEREGRVEIELLSPLGSAGTSVLNPPYVAPPSISRPSDVCYHEGLLFIADHCNHRVQVWRAEDGSFLRMIGTDSAGNVVGQFHSPWGCTVYQNHLFVSDSDNHRIQKFSLSDWSVVKVIGSYGSGLGQLNYPRELSVSNDKLYVVDSDNHRISVFDPESGAALSVIGPSLSKDGNLSLSCPWGILFSHNLLFVSSRHHISVFDSDHNYLYSFGSYGSGAGQFSDPWGMVMVNEKLFVSEYGNHRVQIFD